MSRNFKQVQFDGRAYCGGLFWYPLDGDSSPEAQIDAILLEQNAAFYVARGRPAVQVGLVDLSEPAQKGTVSIAASVADRLSREGLRNFLVAMPSDTPGLWCYVAQNQGLIQFDGDVVGTSDHVRECLLHHRAAAVEWDLIVAPSDWEVEGAVERDRADLLLRPRWMGGSGDARLRPTLRRNADGSASGPGVLTVVCALAVVAEVGGGYAVWRHIQQQMEQEQARAMALQRAFEDSRPWIGKPALAVWGELCARAIAEHAVDLAGWHVSQIQCDPKTRTLHVQWERGPGAQFDDLARLRPGARLRSSAQEPAVAQEQVSLRAPADSPLPVALADVPTRAAWLRQSSRWAEQWREARPQFQSAEKGGTFVPWLLASDLAPQETLRQLALPGSVLTHIEFNQRDGKAVWTVKATHYVRD